MELINKKVLLEKIDKKIAECEELGIMPSYVDVLNCVRNAETIEAEPVVHSEWECTSENAWETILRCVHCGISRKGSTRHPYCPNCGAQMDGKE